MSFDPAGGAISGADDVALSSPQDDQVLTYSSSTEKWQNQDASGGGGDGADVVVAVSGVTVTQANVQIVGRDAPDEQTVELRHVNAAGTTETLLAAVTVAADSTTAATPPSFSRAFSAGDRLRAVRTAGTGSAPLVAVQA